MLRHVLIASLISAAFAFPAAAQDNASNPNFSGWWGRNSFNFEPLPSGPRPLINLKRLPNGAMDPGQLVGDYNNPILKPETAAIVKRNGELAAAGKGFPDPSNQCRPYAPPFNFAMQLSARILQEKDQITFLFNQDDQVRRVRLNDSHPAKVTPSPMGDAVGHFEGDTLVVDTVGVKGGPYMMVDRYGSPITDTLHIVERWRLIDGADAKAAQDNYEKMEGRVGGVPGAMALDADMSRKGLQVLVTVDDPNVFTTPWSANITYRPMREQPWLEQVCAENPNEYYANAWIGLPKSDKPDF